MNPPAKESELTYLQTEPEIIKAWTISKTNEPGKEAIASTPPVSRTASENLWWMLVLAGFAALLLEMIVLAKRGHA